MTEDSDKPAKSGIVSLIVGLLLVGAIGFGSGIGAQMMFDEPASTIEAAKKRETDPATEPDAHTSKDKQHTAETGDKSNGETEHELLPEFEPADDVLTELAVTPIVPVLTNLSEPKNVWIRIEGSILSRKESEVPSGVLAAQAGQQVLAYLRTIKLSEIEGASGLQHVNEDLNEVMRTFSRGEVRQFLISGFIVE